MADFCWDCVATKLHGNPERNDLMYQELAEDQARPELCEGCGFGLFDRNGRRVHLYLISRHHHETGFDRWADTNEARAKVIAATKWEGLHRSNMLDGVHVERISLMGDEWLGPYVFWVSHREPYNWTSYAFTSEDYARRFIAQQLNGREDTQETYCELHALPVNDPGPYQFTDGKMTMDQATACILLRGWVWSRGERTWLDRTLMQYRDEYAKPMDAMWPVKLPVD